jgi:molecular chaperone DnaK
LSQTQQTQINLPFITATAAGPLHMDETLTRAKFQEMTADLIERCRKPFEQAITDAGLSKGQINHVIMVGGSTRMPAVQDLVQSMTGKEPNRTVNPDEVVAVGAAVQAGVLRGDVKDVLLLDVTPLSLGIETKGGVMTKLIERNTTIPTRRTEVFTTADDMQPSVEIHVLQGERPMAKDNRPIGKFILDGIPPSPRGVPQIEVSFDIDANGILSVGAKDKGTGKEQSIRIEASTGLSKEEVERMKAEAAANSETDKLAREKVEKLNEADNLIFQTEKQIKEFGDKIPADKKSDLESSLNSLKEAHKSQDISSIDAAISNLNTIWQAATQEMYQGGQAGDPNAGQDSNASGQSGNNNNGDVTDVEYEEVNDKK